MSGVVAHPPIGLTGATGRVGSRVAAGLAAAGVPARLIVRDASRAPDTGAEVRAVPGGFADRAGTEEALRGLETVFMVSGAESADRLAQHVAFVEAAAAAGVRHLVYTSFDGAAEDCTFTLGRDHWATEQRIRAAGLTFTFLRDNFYLDFLPLMADDRGVIRGPAGDGRYAGVAIADVADVATVVLRDPAAHADATYRLTGPEALSLGEAAARLTAATGRPFSFVDETIEEAYASRAHYGAPDWQLAAWVSTYQAIASGELAEVSDDVPRLLARPATPLEPTLSPPRSP